MKKEFVMMPPLMVEKRIADMEAELLWARTAPNYAYTMRPGDIAYQMTKAMLAKLKLERYFSQLDNKTLLTLSHRLIR